MITLLSRDHFRVALLSRDQITVALLSRDSFEEAKEEGTRCTRTLCCGVPNVVLREARNLQLLGGVQAFKPEGI